MCVVRFASEPVNEVCVASDDAALAHLGRDASCVKRALAPVVRTVRGGRGLHEDTGNCEVPSHANQPRVSWQEKRRWRICKKIVPKCGVVQTAGWGKVIDKSNRLFCSFALTASLGLRQEAQSHTARFQGSVINTPGAIARREVEVDQDCCVGLLPFIPGRIRIGLGLFC